MRATQDLDVLTEQPATTASKRPLGIALAVGSVVLLLDQLTKWWAVSYLADAPCGPDGEGCVNLIGSLRLHLVHNTGASFSTGDGLGIGPVFGVVAVVMSLVMLRMARRRTDVFGPVVLGAVAGGALGNVIDRLARSDGGFLDGAVVDFIDPQWWPVFNVADSAVVVGIILYVLLVMREDGAAAAEEPDGVADAADEVDADRVEADGVDAGGADTDAGGREVAADGGASADGGA